MDWQALCNRIITLFPFVRLLFCVRLLPNLRQKYALLTRFQQIFTRFQNYSPQKRRGLSSRKATMEIRMSPRKRSRDGRGLTSPASSSRSSKPLSRGTATRTWAPERRSRCGPTSPRPGSGYENTPHTHHCAHALRTYAWEQDEPMFQEVWKISYRLLISQEQSQNIKRKITYFLS